MQVSYTKMKVSIDVLAMTLIKLQSRIDGEEIEKLQGMFC